MGSFFCRTIVHTVCSNTRTRTPMYALSCLNIQTQGLTLALQTPSARPWVCVHDLLSRSSVVNCDAVSNPNFHRPLPHPFLVCALLVCLVCGSCFLTLGLRSSCLHTGRSSLCLSIDNTQPQQLQQANQHSLLLTHTIPKVFTYTHSHSLHIVVTTPLVLSCSQHQMSVELLTS